jgi:hypothetical protein
VEGVYDECATQFSQVKDSCLAKLERVYSCARRSTSSCDLTWGCSAEDREYALCVSGGTCDEIGGGSARPPTADQPWWTFEDSTITGAEKDAPRSTSYPQDGENVGRVSSRVWVRARAQQANYASRAGLGNARKAGSASSSG